MDKDGATPNELLEKMRLLLNDEEDFGDTLVYRIAGQLTYVNLIAHQNRVAQVFASR